MTPMLNIPKAEQFVDANYQEIWNAADHRFTRWLTEHIETWGQFPGVKEYTYRLQRAAKEVLDALALDDTKPEEHLDILCFEQGEQYVVDIRALTGIGDAFLMVYRHDQAEQA